MANHGQCPRCEKNDVRLNVYVLPHKNQRIRMCAPCANVLRLQGHHVARHYSDSRLEKRERRMIGS